jgi:hypothetical protein
MLDETAIRKTVARALTTLGQGQMRPDEVPSRVVVAMQDALEGRTVRLPINDSLDPKTETAVVSGVLGLMALSSSSTETERTSAALQMRKAAAEAMVV